MPARRPERQHAGGEVDPAFQASTSARTGWGGGLAASHMTTLSSNARRSPPWQTGSARLIPGTCRGSALLRPPRSAPAVDTSGTTARKSLRPLRSGA
eukprot:350747-Chlamydomonas_euryale.AAC.5